MYSCFRQAFPGNTGFHRDLPYKKNIFRIIRYENSGNDDPISSF